MSDHMLDRLRDALGGTGVERDLAGRPRAAPDTTGGVAAVCRLASEEGWRVRVEGRGTWCPTDAPADLGLTAAALDQVLRVAPADLVATVQAGITCTALARALAPHGVWLPLDPPGRPERTLGSVLATGTSGALRHGCGPVRDVVLGCTVVTGDGRILHAGGSVVKNVAGYDLMKLQVGGFGGFGVLTEVHLRLRALPAEDRTLTLRGGRDDLTAAARDLASGALDAAAIELLSPAAAADAEWLLAVRLLGTADGVAAEADRLGTLTRQAWSLLTPEQAGAAWHSAARAHTGPVTLRLGVLPDGLDDTLDLLAERLDLGLVSAGAASGTLRWSGSADPDALHALRRVAASREIPVTLERGPWALRQAVGHFGAYREGVGSLVARLRDTFDPRGTLVIPLDAISA